jgi:hypothetical protein
MLHRFLIAFLFLFGLTSIAQADPPWARSDGNSRGQGEKHEKQKKHEKRERHNKREPRGHFIDDDRLVIRDYYSRNPGHLPPGLAKRGGNLPPGLAKRNGGLPPGLAKGQVAPSDTVKLMLPLPHELELYLPPPPHEVIRRILGRDIVLLHKHNMKVLDVLKDALP